jgi:hypothetical protein
MKLSPTRPKFAPVATNKLQGSNRENFVFLFYLNNTSIHLDIHIIFIIVNMDDMITNIDVDDLESID